MRYALVLTVAKHPTSVLYFSRSTFQGKKHCFCLVFCFVIFLWRHGLTLWPRMAWNSVSDIGWPRPQPRSFSFRFCLSQLQRLMHMGVGACAEARGQTLVSFLRMIQPGFLRQNLSLGPGLLPARLAGLPGSPSIHLSSPPQLVSPGIKEWTG